VSRQQRLPAFVRSFVKNNCAAFEYGRHLGERLMLSILKIFGGVACAAALIAH
jgi:hypothetical protein